MMMKKLMYTGAVVASMAFFAGCDDECEVNADCPSDQLCIDGSCVTPGGDDGCVVDQDCSNGFACGDDGECVTSCASIEDCAVGYECIADTGACELTGGNAVYDRVLLVSRTPELVDGDDNQDARAPNPGPDIDYVSVSRGGSEIVPVSASGDHGGFAGSAPVEFWASVDEVLVKDSIPNDLPGQCTLSDTPSEESPYFFMGTGQEFVAGETIGDDTGYVVVDFGEFGFQDGDIVQVFEVGSNESGEQVCENIDTDRPTDLVGVYLVSADAPTSIGAGTELTSPDFLYLGDTISVDELAVTFD